MHNSRHDGATANFDFFERRDVGPSPPERDSLNPSPALTSSWRGRTRVRPSALPDFKAQVSGENYAQRAGAFKLFLHSRAHFPNSPSN